MKNITFAFSIILCCLSACQKEDFWKQEYPEIDTASNKIKILEDNGIVLEGFLQLK